MDKLCFGFTLNIMINSTIRQSAAALSDDLNRARPNSFSEVVYDPTLKIFKTRKEGAVFEFPLKQPEREYWTGTKIYGSGNKSKIRIKRIPVEADCALVK